VSGFQSGITEVRPDLLAFRSFEGRNGYVGLDHRHFPKDRQRMVRDPAVAFPPVREAHPKSRDGSSP